MGGGARRRCPLDSCLRGFDPYESPLGVRIGLSFTGVTPHGRRGATSVCGGRKLCLRVCGTVYPNEMRLLTRVSRRVFHWIQKAILLSKSFASLRAAASAIRSAAGTSSSGNSS